MGTIDFFIGRSILADGVRGMLRVEILGGMVSAPRFRTCLGRQLRPRLRWLQPLPFC